MSLTTNRADVATGSDAVQLSMLSTLNDVVQAANPK
jgi:hypothetical protein